MRFRPLVHLHGHLALPATVLLCRPLMDTFGGRLGRALLLRAWGGLFHARKPTVATG